MGKGWRQRATEVDEKAKSSRRNKAERYVFKKLRKEGHKPAWAKTGKGYDIYTRSRRIEVKGKENFKAPNWLGFSANFLKLGSDLNKFWIYLVVGMGKKNKKKRIVKIPSKEILQNLSPRIHYGIKKDFVKRIARKQDIELE